MRRQSFIVGTEATHEQLSYNEVLRLLSHVLRRCGGQVKIPLSEFLAEDKFNDFTINYETNMGERVIEVSAEKPRKKKEVL